MSKQDKKKLFEEFPPVSTAQWEEKIIQDLKGADYDKKLVWKTIDGLKVQPYYRSEHLEKLKHLSSLPGEAPYVRSNNEKINDWEVRQDFEESDPEKANKLALKAIEKGVGSVGLNTENTGSTEELKKLIENIDLSKTPVHFTHAKNYKVLLENLISIKADKNSKGSLNFDPLGYYLLYNKFYDSFDSNIEEAVNLIKTATNKTPGIQVINISGNNYNNAGASIIQELAFSLSQGNEYLASLTDKGLKIDEISPLLRFTISVGSEYFLEIAKLRAFRMLWSKITEQYKPSHEASMKTYIHGECSKWNKSIYDPYVNMLRTTTEAMSAAIGGIDSFNVTPFDETYKKPEYFSYRIARNQQIILKEEAYLKNIVDPAAGSYYVENLTDMIAEAAWNLFVKIEEQGGFIKNVENGFIYDEIEKICQKRDHDIASRKQKFVGTNVYPDSDEKVLDKLEPVAKVSDISKLKQYRGPQAFEAIRLAVENHDKKGFNIPKVFLFTYGNPAMRKARAGFASGFFGVAAYKVIDNSGFDNIEAGVNAAINANPEIIVFCSSDEEYAEMGKAAKIIKEKVPKTKVIVAGNPTDIIDKLKNDGVDDFIHVRTNLLETLSMYNEYFGIV